MKSKAEGDKETTQGDWNLIYYFNLFVQIELAMFLVTISALIYEFLTRSDHFTFQKKSKYLIMFTLIFGNTVCELLIDWYAIKLF